MSFREKKGLSLFRSAIGTDAENVLGNYRRGIAAVSRLADGENALGNYRRLAARRRGKCLGNYRRGIAAVSRSDECGKCPGNYRRGIAAVSWSPSRDLTK